MLVYYYMILGLVDSFSVSSIALNIRIHKVARDVVERHRSATAVALRPALVRNSEQLLYLLISSIKNLVKDKITEKTLFNQRKNDV